MIQRLRRQLRDQRGGVLAFVAAALGMILGMSALAIDLGMLYTARTEAQRAADAAALAGASAFLEWHPDDPVVVDTAQFRAYQLALENVIRNTQIDSADVQSVVVTPEERRVDVTIRREDIGLWFAQILGFDFATVRAHAAAEAVESGSAQCLKPFALPDIWQEMDDDLNSNNTWDFNPWDTGPQSENEIWEFEPENGDRYERYDPTGSDDGDVSDDTGYGGPWRNGLMTDHWTDRNASTPYSYEYDYGRRIMIKSNDPTTALEPGVFYPWVLPLGEVTSECDIQYGGSEVGGKTYAANICNCNMSSVQLGQPYDIEPGNMIGPTKHGLRELIEQDPDAYWDDMTNSVAGSDWGASWESSPRVIKVAMFDPTQDMQGRSEIVFNNFGLLFLEELQGVNDTKVPVVARFLRYVPGDAGAGPTEGPNVLVIRLVQ